MLHLKWSWISDNTFEGKYKQSSRLIAKIIPQNLVESNLIVTSVDESWISFEKPEVLVGKILLLGDGHLAFEKDIKISIIIEELKNKDSNIELNMLLGMQNEITKMIIDLIQK